VPTQHNGRSIYKSIETAYLHADSSDYGWRAVLNEDSVFGALPTASNTSHGKSFERCDTRSDLFYRNSKAGKSS
jgi:hypothetical protein